MRKTVTAAKQCRCKQKQAFWRHGHALVLPKSLFLFAFTLLCSSQLVKPVTVFLIPFEDLLLEVCQRFLLICNSVKVLRLLFQGNWQHFKDYKQLQELTLPRM